MAHDQKYSEAWKGKKILVQQSHLISGKGERKQRWEERKWD